MREKRGTTEINGLRVVLDQYGQPLTCYGCRDALAYPGTQDGFYPGRPAPDGRGCTTCLRNPAELVVDRPPDRYAVEPRITDALHTGSMTA